MKNIIPIIKSLIAEIDQIGIINFKVAFDNFQIYADMDFFNEKGNIRKNKHREDWIFFHELEDILYENDFKDPKKTLQRLKEVEAPDGCLSYYCDPYYTQIANNITNRAIELLSVIEVAEIDIEKDDELLKLYKLQQIQTKKLISREEVEILFNISTSYLDKLRKRKIALPCLGGGSGGILMFNKNDVEEWMMKHL